MTDRNKAEMLNYLRSLTREELEQAAWELYLDSLRLRRELDLATDQVR